MTGEAWMIVFFTIKTSALSTFLILPPGIAIALCDEVLVLERGRLVERGAPDKVLHAVKG